MRSFLIILLLGASALVLAEPMEERLAELLVALPEWQHMSALAQQDSGKGPTEFTLYGPKAISLVQGARNPNGKANAKTITAHSGYLISHSRGAYYDGDSNRSSNLFGHQTESDTSVPVELGMRIVISKDGKPKIIPGKGLKELYESNRVSKESLTQSIKAVSGYITDLSGEFSVVISAIVAETGGAQVEGVKEGLTQLEEIERESTENLGMIDDDEDNPIRNLFEEDFPPKLLEEFSRTTQPDNFREVLKKYGLKPHMGELPPTLRSGIRFDSNMVVKDKNTQGRLVRTKSGELTQENHIHNPLLPYIGKRLSEIPASVKKQAGIPDDLKWHHRTTSADAQERIVEGLAFASIGENSALGGSAVWGHGLYLSAHPSLRYYGDHLITVSVDPDAVLGQDIDIFIGHRDGTIAVAKDSSKLIYEKFGTSELLYNHIQKALNDRRPSDAVELINQLSHRDVEKLRGHTAGASDSGIADFYVAQTANDKARLANIEKALELLAEEPGRLSLQEKRAVVEIAKIIDVSQSPALTKLEAWARIDNEKTRDEVNEKSKHPEYRINALKHWGEYAMNPNPHMAEAGLGSAITGINTAGALALQELEAMSHQLPDKVGQYLDRWLEISNNLRDGHFRIKEYEHATPQQKERLDGALRQVIQRYDETVASQIALQFEKNPEALYQGWANHVNQKREAQKSSEFGKSPPRTWLQEVNSIDTPSSKLLSSIMGFTENATGGWTLNKKPDSAPNASPLAKFAHSLRRLVYLDNLILNEFSALHVH